MKAPSFWAYGKKSFSAFALHPLSCLYQTISTKRANKSATYHSKIPVICIGNLTMGGAGKTPSAIAVAQTLNAQGYKPVFLSRGYGGDISGPLMVDPTQHSAQQVGDEPLLLRQTAPVCISTDRIKGAKFCETQGFDVIIMDDGYQNPYLHKDLSFLVIDGGYGHGNEQVFPSGPLREPIENGLKRADAVILIGDDQTNCVSRLQKLKPELPILPAHIQPITNKDLKDEKVIAFAGIARPEKFYETVRSLSHEICASIDFKDHHAFSPNDLNQLLEKQQNLNAKLVTTEKDWVRLPDDIKKQVHVIKISLVWEKPDMLNAVLSLIDIKSA